MGEQDASGRTKLPVGRIVVDAILPLHSLVSGESRQVSLTRPDC